MENIELFENCAQDLDMYAEASSSQEGCFVALGCFVASGIVQNS